MFGATRQPPTLAEVRTKAANQGNIYFIRNPDAQGRSSYYFEVPEKHYLTLKKGQWLIDGICLERCYQITYKNTHTHLALPGQRWARLQLPDYPQAEYLLADPKVRTKTQVKPPSAAQFKVATRRSPQATNQKSDTSTSSQGSDESSNSITQPSSDQEEGQQQELPEANSPPGPEQVILEDPQGGGEANATEDLSQSIHPPLSPVIQVVERYSIQTLPEPQERQQTNSVLEARQDRADSSTSEQLEWDHIGHQLSDSDELITAAQRRRQSSNDSSTPSTLDNLLEMANGNNEPQESFQDRIRARFEATEALENDDVRTVGNLLAKIENLNAALARTNDYRDLGYPTLLPTVRPIQTPSPSLVTPEVVDQMNEILTDCGTKLTSVLHKAQLKERNRLQEEVKDYLNNFKPTPAQQRAIEIQKQRRTHQLSLVKDLPRMDTHLPILVCPDTTKGQTLVVPNPAMKALFSTGARQSGNGDRQNHGRGRGGNRGHSGKSNNPNPHIPPQDGNQQQNQGGASHHSGPPQHRGPTNHNGLHQRGYHGGGQFQGRSGGRGNGGRGGNYSRGFSHNNYTGGFYNHNQQNNNF